MLTPKAAHVLLWTAMDRGYEVRDGRVEGGVEDYLLKHIPVDTEEDVTLYGVSGYWTRVEDMLVTYGDKKVPDGYRTQDGLIAENARRVLHHLAEERHGTARMAWTLAHVIRARRLAVEAEILTSGLERMLQEHGPTPDIIKD